jgi:hypothetical protein
MLGSLHAEQGRWCPAMTVPTSARTCPGCAPADMLGEATRPGPQKCGRATASVEGERRPTPGPEATKGRHFFSAPDSEKVENPENPPDTSWPGLDPEIFAFSGVFGFRGGGIRGPRPPRL